MKYISKNDKPQNEQLWLLPVQNVRQYHFHDVAKYEKNLPKESINIKEFRPKWGIYQPANRWDVAMVTVLIKKLNTKK